ncbi:MAG TPA: Crp/Fnr family transcriptional regulator [Coleofasciculaceae cyanobacterium]
MSKPSKLWYLSQFKLFSEMSHPEMEEMDRITVMKEYKKAQPIYLPGDPANTIYLLKKGKVRITHISDEGKEATLAILAPGDIFGELALLDEGETRNEVAEALEDCYICLVNKENFEQMLMMKPGLSLKITKFLGLRLKTIENQVQNLVFKDVPARLEELLGRLAKEFGTAHPEGTLVNIKLTHQEIGNLINASRQTVSECLGDLKQQGKIKTEGHKIVLLSQKTPSL